MENIIDQKIEKLLSVTDSIPIIHYYAHTSCDMYMIKNPFSRSIHETIVLCRYDEGFEKALDLAYEQLTEIKTKFFHGS